MARIEVILQPDQLHLQEKVMKLSNDAQHIMPRDMEKVARISLPDTVDTRRLRRLGVEYKKPYQKPGPKMQSDSRMELHLRFEPEMADHIKKRSSCGGYQAYFNELIRKDMQNGFPESVKTDIKSS